jgi:hypothetical protein
MKRTFKIVILAVLAILCFSCAVGCVSATVPEVENKYSFVTSDCIVNLYEEYQVKITPADYEQVKWTVGDTNIATVDQNGKVSAKSIGKTKIIAEVGGEVISTNLSVVYGGNSPSVYLSDDAYAVTIGGKVKVFPKILYKGTLYEDGEFTMEIADQEICTIENGEITDTYCGGQVFCLEFSGVGIGNQSGHIRNIGQQGGKNRCGLPLCIESKALLPIKVRNEFGHIKAAVRRKASQHGSGTVNIGITAARGMV